MFYSVRGLLEQPYLSYHMSYLLNKKCTCKNKSSSVEGGIAPGNENVNGQGHKYSNTVRVHGTKYHNDLKFSDRYAWANSADPDQTAPGGAVWSGSTLFAIPSASFGLITLL